MKKTFFILICLLTFNIANAQLQKGSSGIYAGLGYSTLFFTNSDVSNIYPTFDFRRNSLKSEISPYIGYEISKTLSIEFNPSFLYSNSSPEKGFYFKPMNGGNEYYQPNNAFLFMMPLNLKLKFYPFANAKSVVSNGLFLGLSGGPIFIREEYDNYIYPNENSPTVNQIKNFSNTLWTGDMQLSIGYSSKAAFSYGFEAGYRFIPLKIEREFPLASSIASNMNAVVLSIKLGYFF